MKRNFIALLLFCFFAAGSGLFAQSLDDVLQKYYDAVNQEKLSKVNTVLTSGKLMMQGMEIPLTISQKRPGKVRVEGSFQGMSFVSTYNGEQGWSLNPFMGQTEPQPMTAEELKSTKDQSDIDGFLFDSGKKGYKLELKPDEELDGKKVHVIQVTKPGDDIVFNYLDSSSGLIVKTKAKTTVQGTESDVESLLSNYKTVNGIQMPFSMENIVNGMSMVTIVIDSVSFDSEMADAIFEKPEKK